MKRRLVILLLVVVGCSKVPEEPNTVQKPDTVIMEPTIANQLVRPSKKWIERYGDTEEAAMGFNIVLLLHHNKSQAEQIKDLGERITILERKPNGERNGKNKGKTKGKNN